MQIISEIVVYKIHAWEKKNLLHYDIEICCLKKDNV